MSDGRSVLQAQIEAVSAALAGLDPGATALGLVSCSSRPLSVSQGTPVESRCRTLIGSTTDRAAIRQVLVEFGREQTAGMSDLGALVRQGTVELAGLQGAMSAAPAGNRLRLVLLVAGPPTLPFWMDGDGEQNVSAVIHAADLPRLAGIEVNPIGIGLEDRSTQAALQAIAAMTGGQYLRASTEGELIQSMMKTLSPASPP